MAYEFPDTIKSTYKHPNPLIRWFFNKKINTIINIANPINSDLILDFGSGEGELKNKLKKLKIKVVNYDLNPKHSDIENYTNVKPTKIISIDCFEHIPKSDIPNILKNFKDMNPHVTMIFSIPTENFISRKVRKLLGKPERAKGHITSLKEILEIFDDKLRLIKKKSLFSVSYIGKYNFKT